MGPSARGKERQAWEGDPNASRARRFLVSGTTIPISSRSRSWVNIPSRARPFLCRARRFLVSGTTIPLPGTAIPSVGGGGAAAAAAAAKATAAAAAAAADVSVCLFVCLSVTVCNCLSVVLCCLCAGVVSCVVLVPCCWSGPGPCAGCDVMKLVFVCCCALVWCGMVHVWCYASVCQVLPLDAEQESHRASLRRTRSNSPCPVNPMMQVRSMSMCVCRCSRAGGVGRRW